MTRTHLDRVQRASDDRLLSIRGMVAVLAVLSLPVLGTAVRSPGSTIERGDPVLAPRVFAHAPAVVALLGVWSIGCDRRRTEGST